MSPSPNMCLGAPKICTSGHFYGPIVSGLEGLHHISPCVTLSIRESVDSLCRDDADMPMPPYIGKAYNRPNAAFVSLFR